MIEIECPEHFTDVMQFAINNSCADKLLDRLDYLAKYADDSCTCHLYRDFAPLSFEFSVTRPDGTQWFNGGLIYSGPGQPLDGSAPALTVSLDPEAGKTHGWSVHT